MRAVVTPDREPEASWSWVDEPAALEALVQRLSAAPCFALDTESNSMHAYRERICLVQVSLPDEDVLIDPLAVDLAPLGPVLADASILKIMHGADYDILCFKRGYGFALAGLFDTMLAARVLGWSGYGLGAILAERHDFRANKKMQRFDWGQRPLPEHALDYARYDTHFLHALYRDQRNELQEAGHEDEHAHACLRQTQVEPRPTRAERLGPWRIKGARELPPEGRGVLQAVYDLREAVAEQIDKPVFRVMADAVVLAIARRPPPSESEVRAIRGLHPMLRGRGAARVLRAIEAGRNAEPPSPPPREPGMPKAQAQRFDKLRAWRKSTAAERGVEPDIIIGKDTLIALAVAGPSDREALEATGALDEWELGRYGEVLLEAMGEAMGEVEA